MITPPSTTRLICPKCKLFCKVTGGVVEKLPTNFYALHITTLLGITNNEYNKHINSLIIKSITSN